MRPIAIPFKSLTEALIANIIMPVLFYTLYKVMNPQPSKYDNQIKNENDAEKKAKLEMDQKMEQFASKALPTLLIAMQFVFTYNLVAEIYNNFEQDENIGHIGATNDF